VELLLIRHGKTAGNLRRLYIGRTDEPLCEQGIDHAREQAWSYFPPVKRVYVSPLLRVTQTAAILFPSAKQVVVEEFREMDFGDFEGHSSDELEADPVYRAWIDGLCEAPCPGGERRADFDARVREAFLSLMAKALARDEGRIVILSHGGVIMSLMRRWARPARPFYEWAAPNCGGFRVRIDRAQWERAPVFASWHPLGA
jgi:alpha-ribazole phosphatase